VILRNYLRLIQKGWRLVVICTLLAWMISLSISYGTVPLYRSTATFLIYPNANLFSSSRDVVTSLDALEGSSVSRTYLEIFNSTRVFKDTVEKLELDASIMDNYSVTAEVTTGSNIALMVDGPDPQMAAFLANNIGQNGINYIKSIYQVYDIAFLDQASEPKTPFRPRTLLDGAIAAGIGLVVGLLATGLRELVRVPLETLRERAVTDRESSAYTQKHFLRLMEQEIAQDPAATHSLGLIDLAGLEDLVDGLPEAVLTNLMRCVNSILHEQLRGNDVVGRWGRTAFSVLLPTTPSIPAFRTLDRIKIALSEPLKLEPSGDIVKLQPSIGVASLQKDEPASVLIDHARSALEKARQSDTKINLYAQD